MRKATEHFHRARIGERDDETSRFVVEFDPEIAGDEGFLGAGENRFGAFRGERLRDLRRFNALRIGATCTDPYRPGLEERDSESCFAGHVRHPWSNAAPP